MSVICRIIEKPPATVFSYLRYHGGIEPRVRVRRLCSLSIREREEISRGLAVGASIRSIALSLGRSLAGTVQLMLSLLPVSVP